MTPVSQQLAEFTSGLRFDRLPPAVVEAAKLHALDALGCGLAAHALDAAPWVGAAAREEAVSGPVTAIGMSDGLPAGEAALVNGTLCHALDYDDTHPDAVTHVSAAVVPAALAAAEQHGADGRDVLCALVAGSETSVRIGMAGGGKFHARGLHPTGVCGVFGATAAAARLRGLDAEHTAHALGIAASMASGLLEFLADGSKTKPLHPGWAAHAGLAAARLAAHGATGPATALEGRRGFFGAYLHGEAVDAAAFVEDLGTRWRTPEIAFKPYPACHYTHAPLDALAALVLQEGITADDVESLVAISDRTGSELVLLPLADKLHPRTPYDAKFSLPVLPRDPARAPPRRRRELHRGGDRRPVGARPRRPRDRRAQAVRAGARRVPRRRARADARRARVRGRAALPARRRPQPDGARRDPREVAGERGAGAGGGGGERARGRAAGARGPAGPAGAGDARRRAHRVHEGAGVIQGNTLRPRSRSATVADRVVATLKASGVRRIYGLPGDSLNALTDALRRDGGLAWQHVRHEEAAAFAAAAEAAVTGGLGVCAASCGPGNLHLVNGLFDAQRSRVPVLALAAHIPREEIGGGYFQETHPQELFRECSVFCELVSVPAQLPRLLEIAMRTALERGGVAVLVVPGEVFGSTSGARAPAPAQRIRARARDRAARRARRWRRPPRCSTRPSA